MTKSGETFGQKERRFPRWEIVLPNQDLRSIEDRENPCRPAATSTNTRETCPANFGEDWPTACTYRNSWTHSDKRLSQVCERGGRGLLKDECWSFPPTFETISPVFTVIYIVIFCVVPILYPLPCPAMFSLHPALAALGEPEPMGCSAAQ